MTVIELGNHRAKALVPLSGLHSMRFKTADIQRDLNHDRVKKIVQYQTQRHKDGHGLFFVGDIVVWEANGTYFVLDGQHRLEAMKRLVALDPGFEVSIDLIRSPPGLTIESAFELINSNDPVPDYIRNVSGQTRRRPVLDRLGMLMNRHFGAFTSSSVRPHVPNINVTQLLERLNESAIIDSFDSGDDLFHYIEWVNVTLLAGSNSKVDAAATKKADAKGVAALYLRADEDYEWLDDVAMLRKFRAPLLHQEDLMAF